jgi:hypothetical protein
MEYLVQVDTNYLFIVTLTTEHYWLTIFLTI